LSSHFLLGFAFSLLEPKQRKSAQKKTVSTETVDMYRVEEFLRLEGIIGIFRQ
jgi:hypothetical protein